MKGEACIESLNSGYEQLDEVIEVVQVEDLNGGV